MAGLSGVIRRNPGRQAGALFRHLSAAAALSAAVRNEGIEHLHAYWAGPVASLAKTVAAAHSIAWSFTGHRGDIASGFELADHLRDASWVRAISRRSAGMMAEIAATDAEDSKVDVLHLGYRLGRPVGERPPQPVSRIIVPANLLPVKGHVDLLQALMLVETAAASRLSVEFFGDGPERGHLERVIDVNRLEGRVMFRGWVSHDRLMSEFARPVRQVVVLPSRSLGATNHEGIPISLVEAMARGNPVIATDSGGIPELLDGGAGLIAEHSNPVSLAAAIDRLATEPELYDLTAKLGRRRIEEQYDVDLIASEFIESIRAITPGRGRGERVS